MNIYIKNIETFIKKISKKYYRTLDEIKIIIGDSYKIYLICFDIEENKFIIFKIIIEKFNKNIINYVKKYLNKKQIHLDNNNYIIYNVYKK